VGSKEKVEKLIASYAYGRVRVWQSLRNQTSQIGTVLYSTRLIQILPILWCYSSELILIWGCPGRCQVEYAKKRDDCILTTLGHKEITLNTTSRLLSTFPKISRTLNLEGRRPEVGLLWWICVNKRTIESGISKSHLVECNFGEQNLRLLVVDGGMDNDIFTLFPINGGCNLVLIAQLESYESDQ